MFQNGFHSLLAAAAVAAMAGAASGQESASVFDYLGQRATRRAAALPAVSDTADTWEKQRVDLVKQLAALLGLPDREPMKAAVTESAEEGDLVVERVVYHWAGPTYASATVIRAKSKSGRQPAIVIPSGWLGHHTFLPYRKFVDAKARQGLVVLFVDDPRAGLRQSPAAGLYAAASAAGTSVAGIQAFDAIRGLDYLLTRADVDPGKIGIAGLGEGALQAILAAAVEPRFRFVVAVGGATTYEALVRSAAAKKGPEDPSAFVPGILAVADVDRIAACIAPRPVFLGFSANDERWPADGHAQVLATMQKVYKLCGAENRIRQVEGESSDDFGPFVTEIGRWLGADVLASLASSDAAPLPCGAPEEPNFSLLRYLQRRIAAGAAPLPAELTEDAWRDCRKQCVDWLRGACAIGAMKPAADKVVETAESGGLTTERLVLGVDADFGCPAVLVRPSDAGAAKHAGVVLSHDDRSCAAGARIADAARRLASAGFWVIVPEHASVDSQSRQPLAGAEDRSFYGDEAARFYGPADAVGLPPLALRVAEDLAAFRCLAARAEVDPAKIVMAGLGVGGVDACLAAVLDERIAGVASVDATTVRDWAANVAPGELRFFHIMPYLPSMKADLDRLYAAVAPRPLAIARLKDGWPRTGFEEVAASAAAVYKLAKSDGLLVFDPRDFAEEPAPPLPEGVPGQLVAAARTLVPTPPKAGIVGTLDGLKSRQTCDSAAGLIWIVAEMDGYEQELTGKGYQLKQWGFFNDNGDAQKGRKITPLVFKKDGDKYLLTGIGTTRVNAGTGLQTFPFEPVQGTDQAGDGYFFGWHTGDLEGKQNPGVVEFEDAPDALMVILTSDGQMGGQRLKVGEPYRVQSQFRRRYSVTAESKKP